MKRPKPVVLIILDGWGLAPAGKGNAISLAKTPNFDFYWQNYAHTTLGASGEFVGLPKGFQGNSEAGHLNLGSGRVFRQMLGRITESIDQGKFFKNKAFLKAVQNCRKHHSALHLMGLVQDEGVHALDEHLFALMKLAKNEGLKEVWIHFFADGRDTPPKSALKFLRKLEKKAKALKIGNVGTVMGRYYAMDRDNRWPRTEKAFKALVDLKGFQAKSASAAIKMAYKRGETDEFIKPTVIGGFPGIKENDSVIFFNYRPDRARQLTKAFVQENFNHFRRRYFKTSFVCMTNYYKNVPALVAFRESKPKNILGEVLARKGLRQLRISETEKYAHVTYFFNSQIEKPFKKEERIMIPSPQVATYDLKPEMSVFKISKSLVKELKNKKFDFVVCNLVNCDMVGHTGKITAVIKAVEAVDKALGEILAAVRKQENGVALIVADHGNAEKVRGKKGGVVTSHTTNRVPCLLVSDNARLRKMKLKKGCLGNIAPTILQLLGIKKPKEMIGSLLTTILL